MVEGADFMVPGQIAGVWVFKTADLSAEGLTNVREYRPGEDVIYENHGFSHDGKWLYFSSNMKRSRAVNEATDIYRLHLETGRLVRLTDEAYIEHAHLSPDGKYIVFQSEMQDNPRDSARAQPGLGVFMNLWLMDREGRRFWQLTDLPATGDNGVLHPHFSSDGATLTWSRLTKGGNPFKPTGLLGYWKLKIAEFDLRPEGPVLDNVREYAPGGPAFYENHGQSPDGRYLLFTSNSGAQQILQLSANDIYRLDLETEEVIQLTEGSYNEVAHWSPDGRKIVWMSSEGNPNKGTDYWMMNPDGSGKIRLTNFNDPKHPVTKAPVYCADFDWGPGSDRLVAYIQRDLVTQEGMTVIIELAESTVR